MPDLEIGRDGELMVAQVEAQTEAGEEFVDAYQPGDRKLVVVDAGRIIVSTNEVPSLMERAAVAGLTMEVEER